tara:strand:- start:12 stop:1004 length:993 start_codon:yes stop_codon:yes gene_type:complete
MNNIDDPYVMRVLNDKEQKIYNNLLKILAMKRIEISTDVIINYIRSHDVTNIYITTEIIEQIIEKCLDIQNSKYIEKGDGGVHLGENTTKVSDTIQVNEHSMVPIRELREELIYIKGISGNAGNFTNTFLLNKTFNNVESIELLSGYVNDSRDPSGPSELNESGILNVSGKVVGGSIGPIPFIWIDIEEPTINVYSHYANYTVQDQSAVGECCAISGQGFENCNPYGSFFVELKHYSAVFWDLVEDAPPNMVYMVDKPGNYIKKFNNLLSLNKFKINIRNIAGNTLWGHDRCGLGSGSSGYNRSNLLRWEFVFKVKYYINVLDNTFTLQN